MPNPQETSTNRHYLLSTLIGEARAEAPAGRTYAVKRPIFPPELPETMAIFRPGQLATLRVLDAKPEAYVVSTDRLAGGLAIANFALIAEDWTSLRVRRAAADAGAEHDPGIGREVTARRFRGRLMLPEVRSADVIGAYVPGEDSTGFVHVLDPDKLAAMEDVFENGMLREQDDPPVPGEERG